MIQYMTEDRLAGDVQKDFGEGECVGPKAGTYSGDRDDGFQSSGLTVEVVLLS